MKMEETAHTRELIQAVIAEPTKENILAWRNGLDSYVPPFIEVA